MLNYNSYLGNRDIIFAKCNIFLGCYESKGDALSKNCSTKKVWASILFYILELVTCAWPTSRSSHFTFVMPRHRTVKKTL
jgi:hypothetical protein